MNLKQALKLTSQRYDELQKLNPVKRTSIILWFYKNWKDILNDEDFALYKTLFGYNHFKNKKVK